ncbi:MAG: hypothetical protein JRI73_11790 [Deltaproteobacteria bacterium]|nr:hypothetical protein [Deltaproteobacteria bacterium]
MSTRMNPFESLCKLVSDKNWSWKLVCTTCGTEDLRYALMELATGKSPEDGDWLSGYSTKSPDQGGSPPRRYTENQKEKILSNCLKANIFAIAEACRFPDWLGSLGLVLEDMFTYSETYRLVSSSWALQLGELVSAESKIHTRLQEVVENDDLLLNAKDLEACEKDMVLNSKLYHAGF